MNKIIIENLKDFNLDHIFDCGQCFRWERKPDGAYTGIAFGKVVGMKLITADDVETKKLFQTSSLGSISVDVNNVQFEPERGTMQTTTPGISLPYQPPVTPISNDSKVNNVHSTLPGISLLIDNCTTDEFETIWKEYLDLDRDYSAIKAKLSEDDPVMAEAIAYGQGIRILKQDLWETIVSFIISQNNNIPRIKGCIENLAKMFGQPVGEYEGRAYYSLPGPEVLASLTEADLGPVRLGYRSKYLIETGKAVCRDGLPENEEQLASLCGV